MVSDQSTGSRSWRDVLDVAATLAVIVLCLTVSWALVSRALAVAPESTVVVRPPNRPAPAPLPTEPVSIAGAAMQGSRTASVAIIQYSEFKCSYCGVFARDTLPALEQKYIDTGKVLLAFRHFPLDALHPFARQAAQAAECAGRQGQFWALHDRMFANQAQLDAVELESYVKSLGLDSDRFGACLRGNSATDVQEDAASGQALGVTGTPTFFIGLVQVDGRVKLVQRLAGAQSIKQFEAVLDRLLAEAPAGTK